MSAWWRRWRRLLTACLWATILIVEIAGQHHTGWMVFAAFCLGGQLKWGYDEPLWPKTSREEITE